MTSLQGQSRPAVKRELGDRLRRVRMELHGEHGGPELARLLGIPARTWSNYEAGFTIPGECLLALIDLTGVEPRWLLRGGSTMFRTPPEDGALRPRSRDGAPGDGRDDGGGQSPDRRG